MGYSYDMKNRLCCDHCGKSGGVTRRRCPFRWCPSPALCKSCGKDMKKILSTAYHRSLGCDKSTKEFHIAEIARKVAEAAGLPVIRSGVNCGDGVVFAWTTAGNYRLPVNDYRVSLKNSNHVLDTRNAVSTLEERP